MIIEISDYYIKKCEKFADDQLKTSSSRTYMKRGAPSQEKIRQDIITGRKAEIGAYLLLKEKYSDITKPDFKIYKGRKKSFAADLTTKSENYHVKSMSKSQADKYGLSWMLQKTDPLVVKPAPNDFLVPCLVDGNTVDIKGIFLMTEIKMKKLIKQPKLEWLRKNKVTIYWEDIKL